MKLVSVRGDLRSRVQNPLANVVSNAKLLRREFMQSRQHDPPAMTAARSAPKLDRP